MALQPGTRVVIDAGPQCRPLLIGAERRMAEYEASAEIVTNMKKGKGLAVQGRPRRQGQVISRSCRLRNFAKVRRPSLQPIEGVRGDDRQALRGIPKEAQKSRQDRR